ncbi:MAG: endolytic transglycosylase MltG [Elusimicrobia bacterium]|nr:endolytic transglycosylase MltG [Elusimicrobiota bacterium]
MNRFNKIVFSAVFLLAAFLAYFCWPGAKAQVVIPEGVSAGQVAAILKQNGVILSSNWFKLLVMVTGSAKKIMPGNYSFRKYMSAEEVVWRLRHSTYINQVKIVIPEGWRMEQIAERLQSNGVTDKNRFMDAVNKGGLEGYLFPSTYYFEKNTPAQEVVNLLNLEFDRRVRPLFSKGFPSGLDEKKTLILASIVEREAAISSERPLIAAVYLNRTRKGMPLEADPTVQYALGYSEKGQTYWKKGLTLKDLKIKSAYNTYKVGGFPPGPICNPGYDSVLAVLNPADIDAFYFVADRKGKHIFNAKFSEHLKAKRRVEQASKESNR